MVQEREKKQKDPKPAGFEQGFGALGGLLDSAKLNPVPTSTPVHPDNDRDRFQSLPRWT